ncbi:MAG: efflux RND transporter periplasmic adaptor subunit [Pikeienuella sp.]
MFRIITPFILIAVFGLTACEDETENTGNVDRIRAIKTFAVTQPTGGQTRSFSGILAASATSALSFSVTGTTATVNVADGDSVLAGDILAELDPEPLQLDVREAQSRLDSARATYEEKLAAVNRQRTLYQKGWLAKAGLDQALAAFEVSEGEVNVARSRLATTERALGKATLKAPFDGVIANRDVEPFQEVSAGQALFQINANGAMEVKLSVPDTVVGRIASGANVEIDVATVSGCGCNGRVTEIGVASGAANAVQVTAVLSEIREGILPGMSAEVVLPLISSTENAGFLIPLTAIAPGDDRAKGYVFIFDQDKRVVRKTAITPGQGVMENLVAVSSGVAAGDILASAGVSFLRDGQAVKLLGE